jgi:polysaccharide biosynthesis transport protein
MNQQVPIAQSISLIDVMRGVANRKLLVFLITLLAFGLAFGFVRTAKPLYSTEALVLIENLASPYDRVQTTDEQRTEPVDDRVIQSQMSVIKSQDLSLRVIQSLNLQERAEFDSLKSGVSLKRKVMLALGFGEDPRLKTLEQRALGTLTEQLNVFQVPQSNVVTVRYSSADPKTAAEVANSIVDLYVNSTAETRLQPTKRAREWLAQQINALRSKVATSDAKIEEFRSQSGLLKGQTATLGSQALSELNSQITLAEAARTEAQEKAKSIKNILATKGTVDDSTEVVNSAIIQRLREQQVTSARRVAELSATYLPNHPKMIAAQNDLSNINRQMRSEALKIVDSLDQIAKIALARENSLRAKLEEIKGKESNANLDDVKLKALERDSAADKSLLESLLLRYADASARQDLSTQPGLARVIQRASTPTIPSFPRSGPIVLLATIAGFALSLGLAFLMEIMAAAGRLNQQINYVPAPKAEAVAPPFRRYETQSVASVVEPKPELAQFPVGSTLLANHELLGVSARQDSYGLLASANIVAQWILQLSKGAGLGSMGIATMSGGVADSSMATVVIARALSSQGARVVAIDLAAHGSCIGTLFGLQNGPGFVDLLAGTTDFTKVIIRDPLSSVHHIRWGQQQNAVSLLDQRTDAVLAALKNIYDVVIVHAGEASAQTPQLLGKCEAAVLLAPARRQLDVSKAAQALVSMGLLAVQYVKLEPWQSPETSFAVSA